MQMNQVEHASIEKALIRFAKKDLETTRKHGINCMDDTKIGTFQMTYEKGLYRVTRPRVNADGTDAEVEVLMEGKASVATEFLIKNYLVEIE